MNIQVILIIVIAAGALFFLGARFYKLISGKNKSGDCPNCGMDSSVKLPEKKTDDLV